MLKKIHSELIRKYSKNEILIQSHWNEIEFNYSKRNRYYHYLIHLSNLLKELEYVKDKINDWKTILFTLFYHDIIYNPLRSDNEEKNAQKARDHMATIGVNSAKILKCYNQIIATKSHNKPEESDTNFFTDADLSILGFDQISYQHYFQNVRKEYAIYPSFLFNKGRKKVLLHFLNMERIYKTKYFFEKLEVKAKQNLKIELELLS